MRIFVTGGAGYIGSHVVKNLGEAGHEVLVYDNLSKGSREAVLFGQIVTGDISDRCLLEQTLRSFRPDVVMHFAAFIEVAESVREPARYYRNNLAATMILLDTMLDCGVTNFIFSSTAAVYGIPEKVPIPADAELRPINPYGRAKASVEMALRDISGSQGLRYVSLRYFNAAGADPSARIGESHNPESHLIPLVLKAAKGERDGISIFGTDYPTPDGTCIRDYVHVEDLSLAHILSLDYLLSNGRSIALNCGYGRGFSVREVIDTVKKVTKLDFRVTKAEPRPGDPPILIADSSCIKQTLGWRPRYDDLEYIVKTAWEWERKR